MIAKNWIPIYKSTNPIYKSINTDGNSSTSDYISNTSDHKSSNLDGKRAGIHTCSIITCLLFSVVVAWLEKDKISMGIQHVADIVRLAAVFDYGGWWADGDLLVRNIPVHSPSKSGCVFNSLHAPARPAYCKEPERFWRLNGLKEQCDQCWIAGPWYFSAGSLVCKSILDQAWAQVQLPTPPTSYIWLMKLARDTIWQLGLMCDVLPPSAFNPVPYWMAQASFSGHLLREDRQSQGHPVQSTTSILERSYGVCQTFASTKPVQFLASTTEGKNQVDWQSLCLEEGSLLFEIYSQLGLPVTAGEPMPATFFQGSAQAGRAIRPYRFRSKKASQYRGVMPGGLEPGGHVLGGLVPSEVSSTSLACRSLPDVVPYLFHMGRKSLLNYWDWHSFFKASRCTMVWCGPMDAESMNFILQVLNVLATQLEQFTPSLTQSQCDEWGSVSRVFWHRVQQQIQGTQNAHKQTNSLLLIAKKLQRPSNIHSLMASACLFCSLPLTAMIPNIDTHRRAIRQRWVRDNEAQVLNEACCLLLTLQKAVTS